MNAYYLLRVANVGSAPTSGLVSATENVPAGLTVTSMIGQGWTCTVNSCSRSDALAAGTSYPTIMVVASVAPSASSSLTNQVTVSGSGDSNAANNLASDVTAILARNFPMAWGGTGFGQSTLPEDTSNIVAVSAGGQHSLALKSDGTVIAWGWNGYGQTNVPTGLSKVVAIAAGWDHSMALQSDGTVVTWGDSAYGLTTVPAGLSDVIAIAAGVFHSLALRSDGTVVAWGDGTSGQTTVPAGLSGVAAIAAGQKYSLALKNDGTIVAWGDNSVGETAVPAGLSNVTAIAAGNGHSLALKSDGTVVAWGGNDDGEANVPAGLSDVMSIAAGGWHSLALKSDGTVLSWGYNGSGQATMPSSLPNVVAIAAGTYNSLALVSTAPSTIPVTIGLYGRLGPLTVDGATYATAPVVLDWQPGAAHTIGTTSMPVLEGATKYVFIGWTDGGAVTHTVAPTVATTYTGNFKRQYLITTAASPQAGGSISPATGFFDSGSSVEFTATPNPGYAFAGFADPLNSTANPQSFTISYPTTVTANFIPGGSGGSSCTYAISPTGQSFPATGGTGIITVTTQSGCTWNATDFLPWSNLNGSAYGSGTGTATVSFRVAANAGANRSGSFAVAGQIFNVEQVASDTSQFTSQAVFPHFASGGGWNTRLTLINTGKSPITARVNFLADTGAPVALPLSLPQTSGNAHLLAATLERTLTGGATLVIDTASADPLSQTGWVQVLASGIVAGYDNFRLSAGNGFREVFLPLQSANASTMILPFDHTGSYGTGIALANSSATNSTIGVIIRDDRGSVIQMTDAIQLQPQGHISFDLAAKYPGSASQRGTIELDGPGSGGIGALGVRYSTDAEIAAVVPVVK